MNQEENIETPEVIERKIKIGQEELQKTYKVEENPMILELRADLSSNIGINYSKLNNFEQAKHFLQLALVEYGKLKLKQKMAAIQGSLGSLYLVHEDFKFALKFYEDSYDFWKTTNFLNERITCLQNLGYIHLKLNDEVRASDYIFEALKKAIALKDELQFATSIEVLLNYYEKKERYDLLLELKKKAYDFWKSLGLNEREWKTLIDLGVICQILKNFTEALVYFKKAFNVAYNIGNLEKMFHAQGFIAECQIKLKEIDKGKHIYLQAFKLAVYINVTQDFQQHVDEMRASLLILGVDPNLIQKEQEEALKEANVPKE